MLFRGKLVNLRSVREEDLELAAGYLSDPELMLQLDDDAPIPNSKEKQKEWFSEYLKRKSIYDGVEFAIESKDGKYLGNCGVFHVRKKNRSAEVGIFIGDKDYLGKGYGTEAMRLMLDFIFTEMNLNRVGLHVFSFNTKAIKSYEKCGFKLETVSREAIFRCGKYHDLCGMSILREEYFQNHKEEVVLQ